MPSDEETTWIKRKLEECENRIKNLEKLLKGSGKKRVAKRKTILDLLEYLKSEGFFDQPRITKEIIERLAKDGCHYRPESLTHPLQRAIRQKVLGRIKKNGKWAHCKR